jgi:hypothetical protein
MFLILFLLFSAFTIPENAAKVIFDQTVPAISAQATGYTYVGKAYVDPGATAWDNLDGDITARITTTGVPVDVPSPGVRTITYSAADSCGNVGTATRAVTVYARPTIITTEIPFAMVGKPFSCALRATGGLAPYNWYVYSGMLPDGLRLSSRGILSGMPTRVQTQRVVIGLGDANGWNATRPTFIVHVCCQ